MSQFACVFFFSNILNTLSTNSYVVVFFSKPSQISLKFVCAPTSPLPLSLFGRLKYGSWYTFSRFCGCSFRPLKRSRMPKNFVVVKQRSIYNPKCRRRVPPTWKLKPREENTTTTTKSKAMRILSRQSVLRQLLVGQYVILQLLCLIRCVRHGSPYKLKSVTDIPIRDASIINARSFCFAWFALNENRNKSARRRPRRQR